jgi:hypothetical protein
MGEGAARLTIFLHHGIPLLRGLLFHIVGKRDAGAQDSVSGWTSVNFDSRPENTGVSDG